MTEELDPKKYHVLNSKQKKLTLTIGIIFVLVFGTLFSYFYYKFAVDRPAQTDKDSTFRIESGQGLSEIAGSLYKAGLLNSEFLFKAYVVANHLNNNIQAGIYKIPAGASVKRLSEILQHGTNDVSLTFIEGWRVEEFARLAVQNLKNVDYEKFVKLASASEGYLFPDTYFLNNEIDEAGLLKILTETFSTKTQDVLTAETLAKTELTKEQAVILASIVEREVSTSEDRPTVAGILIKRWRNNILIGADATTQYAVAKIKAGCADNDNKVCPSGDQSEATQWWPKELTNEDLALDSPYNTRKVLGLPPTPISNPSLDALTAVLNYIDTNYNYYLTDKEGVAHYATTLEEHHANVAKYLLTT
jgi:UPF0755 protein